MADETTTQIKARDGRDDMPLFIHSELDDYPLTLVEFRVYARLARRCGKKGAYESVPSMARDFAVSDRTVQRALRLLILAQFIEEHPQPGKATIYTLLPRTSWIPAEHLSSIREQIIRKPSQVVTPQPGVDEPEGVTPGRGVSGDMSAGGDTRDGGTGDTGAGGVVTPERDEGSPIGSPSEGSPTHTHTDAPPPGQSESDQKRVCVCKKPHGSEFCDEERLKISPHIPGVTNPVGYAMFEDARAGLYDLVFREHQAEANRTPDELLEERAAPENNFMLFAPACDHFRAILGYAPQTDPRRVIEQMPVDEEVRALLIEKFVKPHEVSRVS